MRALGWLISGALALGLIGGVACSPEAPKDDYTDFLGRADRESDAAPEDEVMCAFEDLSGRWLLRSLLSGGVELGLRLELTLEAPDAPGCEAGADFPGCYAVRLWLHDQTEGEPIVVTRSVIRPDGTFTLVADPLNLGTEVIMSEAPVTAVVAMEVCTRDAELWCGTADGAVTSPLQFDLGGSTFSARRDPDDRLTLDDLPFACPGEAPPDAGVPDAGVDGGLDASPPPTPDLSGVNSELADIGGQWIFRARLGGVLSINLWFSLAWGSGPEGALIDGVVRHPGEGLDVPPITTFSALVDADGRFLIWLPGFSLDLGRQSVEADILLAGATLSADSFCGFAAGEVREPLALPLDGSTFGAIRWVPGDPLPEVLPDRCPEE